MAERWGLVARSVAKLADPPRVPRHEISPLTPEQARRLIELAEDDRYRALYVTARWARACASGAVGAAGKTPTSRRVASGSGIRWPVWRAS